MKSNSAFPRKWPLRAFEPPRADSADEALENEWQRAVFFIRSDVHREAAEVVLRAVREARDCHSKKTWEKFALAMYRVGAASEQLSLWSEVSTADAKRHQQRVRAVAGGSAMQKKKDDRAKPIEKAYRLLRKDGYSDREAVTRIMKDKSLVGTLERRTVRDSYTNVLRAEFD